MATKKAAIKKPKKSRVAGFKENGPLVDGNYIRGVCNALGLNPIENLCRLAMYSDDEKIKLQASSKLADYLVVLCNDAGSAVSPYEIYTSRADAIEAKEFHRKDSEES